MLSRIYTKLNLSSVSITPTATRVQSIVCTGSWTWVLQFGECCKIPNCVKFIVETSFWLSIFAVAVVSKVVCERLLFDNFF